MTRADPIPWLNRCIEQTEQAQHDWNVVHGKDDRDLAEHLTMLKQTVKRLSVQSEHGWTCYNEGPQAYFWCETREQCEHELSDDIRPATALEKMILQRFGNSTEALLRPALPGDARDHSADVGNMVAEPVQNLHELPPLTTQQQAD